MNVNENQNMYIKIFVDTIPVYVFVTVIKSTQQINIEIILQNILQINYYLYVDKTHKTTLLKLFIS